MLNQLLHLFTENISALLLLVALMFITVSDHGLSRKRRRMMIILVLSLFLMILFDDFISGSHHDLSSNSLWLFENVAYAGSYILRPFLLLILFDATSEGVRRHIRMLLFGFFSLHSVIILTSYWTHLGVYITRDHEVHYGPWHNVYFFYCILVFLTIMLYPLLKHRKFSRLQLFTGVFSSALLVVDQFLYTLHEHKTAPVISSICVLYFLCDYIERSNRTIRNQQEHLINQQTALRLSQIRPHFIYNTLNTIYALCFTDPDVAGETTLQFSNFLRNSVRFSEDVSLIPIADELQHTRLYTDIEQKRFPALTIEYEIEDDGYQIPPLSIQPMVENAIRHGVRGRSDGRILIRTDRMPDGTHRILIHDNGDGTSRAPESLDDHRGIGIPNVRSRIEELCGGTFSIDMDKEKGTTVVITIP